MYICKQIRTCSAVGESTHGDHWLAIEFKSASAFNIATPKSTYSSGQKKFLFPFCAKAFKCCFVYI